MFVVWHFQYTFSIHGDNDNDDGKYGRRFYIRHDTSTQCDTDKGWLFVGDEKGNCPYETKIKEKPFILYSKSSKISKGNVNWIC